MIKALPRRTLLRGFGTALALPLLDAMVPARAAARAAKPPVRMAFLYVANGFHMPEWRPTKVGPDYDLKRILAPLAPVKQEVSVLTGLAQDNAAALGDGPGDHARALSTFLTGVHITKTHGANIRAGVSADQLAAAKIGHLTRLPSLELGVEKGAQSGSCDSGYSCAYSSNLSWKTATMPAGKETNPAIVFDRLFGEPGGPRYDRQRRSLLDFVREDLDSLQPRLGGKDRAKLDEYLTSVRELEARIARTGALPPVTPPGFGRPDGAPGDYQEHIRLMADLLVAAFEADVTRIATFLVTNDSSNRSYPWLDVPEGHHDLSHHGGDHAKHEKLVRINTFHVSQLAYLLGKLKSVREGDGTLLDASMVVYGSGISDGDRHNHDDLPILLAGRGGGTLRAGRHVKVGKAPLNNLFLSMLDRMGAGADVESFGDSTGRLGALDGAAT
jgi:hypothetical protein